jgi:hypothetical protein
MDDDLTPADLARELGVGQLVVRNALRSQCGKLVPPETRWRLTDKQAAEIRAHFRS